MNILGFHGTNQKFDQFDQRHARITQDFYGGGILYVTDNLGIAKNYAKQAVKRAGGLEIIYKVRLNLNKVFDVNKIYTGRNLIVLIGSNADQFARSANLMPIGVDKFKVLSDLRNGNLELTGEQVFRGMSRGMINTANARDMLIRNHYDGLRYNGGMNMRQAINHNVYIAYKQQSITIVGINQS